MCLGIPGKVVEIRDDGELRMARVDFGGVRQDACLAYVPNVQVGDYVIIHVGFAISQLDEEEALKTLELLRMLDPEGLELELGSLVSEPAAEGSSAAAPHGVPPAPPTPGAA